MKKFGLLEIISNKNMDIQTKKALLQVPKIYVCDCVEDFEFEKGNIKERYSSILLSNIFLEPELTYDDKVCQYLHDENQSSIGFWISDDTYRLNVLWPYVETTHLTPKKLESYIEDPTPKYKEGVMLIHDKEYNNTFLMMIMEDSYKSGIEKVMQDIWPKYNV